MKEVVIVSAARTPLGSLGGGIGSFTAAELGVIAAKEAIKRANISPDMFDEVLVGNVLSAGQKQGVGRQIGVNSGVPNTTPAMSINKICGSGLRAIAMAAQFIKAEDADVILAGGAESMTNAPYLLQKGRYGYRMGPGILEDSMVLDGLTDAFNDYHMGVTAENIASKWKISREEQDEFALESQTRAEKAMSMGKLKDEITSITVPQRKGEPIVFDADEYPKKGMTIEKLRGLRPAFKKEGTVTAGNASGVNDGAAMMVVMSKDKAVELGLQPLARIVSYASAGVDPSIMGYGVVPAVRKALEKAKLTVADLDLIEANEAFAVQAICVCRELGFDMAKTNVNGGSIAYGHPIGASGARILTTLLYELRRQKRQYGLATLCIGGGMGTAMIVEAM